MEHEELAELNAMATRADTEFQSAITFHSKTRGHVLTPFFSICQSLGVERAADEDGPAP